MQMQMQKRKRKRNAWSWILRKYLREIAKDLQLRSPVQEANVRQLWKTEDQEMAEGVRFIKPPA